MRVVRLKQFWRWLWMKTERDDSYGERGSVFIRQPDMVFQKEEVEKVFALKDRSISRSIIRLAAETSVYF